VFEVAKAGNHTLSTDEIEAIIETGATAATTTP
jgi:hypothetical protein